MHLTRRIAITNNREPWGMMLALSTPGKGTTVRLPMKKGESE